MILCFDLFEGASADVAGAGCCRPLPACMTGPFVKGNIIMCLCSVWWFGAVIYARGQKCGLEIAKIDITVIMMCGTH